MDLERAWMLHSRPYKERSVIAEFLVENHGRVAMVVRGVRQARSANAALLQPFNRVLVSWKGRGELKTLTRLEPDTNIRLTGNALYCGFYINELLLRAMVQGQNIDRVNDLYESIIAQLTKDIPVEPLLRTFELELLRLAGYSPVLDLDAKTGEPLQAGSSYRFIPEFGLQRISESESIPQNIRPFIYSAELLMALAERNFNQPDWYTEFKRFTRQALKPLIGDRPLQSRALFQRIQRTQDNHSDLPGN